MHKPNVILLMSGKRKCGKDYLAELLRKKLNNASIVRISEPLKGQYAKQHDLDHKELMTDGPYKELYRKAMIQWSDEIRAKEPGFFCRVACENAESSDIWILSDIRRKTDVVWFYKQFGNNVTIKTVRITADDDVRISRGWRFTQGVDDVTSECDLDDYESWDLVVKNNQADVALCEEIVNTILSLIS